MHEIDLKDHGAANPLEFLTMTGSEYQDATKPYGNGRSLRGLLDGRWEGKVFCNRLRLSDWLSLFEREGLETLEAEPVLTLKRDYIPRERLAEEFRLKSDEDLAVLAVRIVGRKRRS